MALRPTDLQQELEGGVVENVEGCVSVQVERLEVIEAKGCYGCSDWGVEARKHVQEKSGAWRQSGKGFSSVLGFRYCMWNVVDMAKTLAKSM